MYTRTIAPHVAEELWEAMGHEDSVFAQTWPTYDEEAMKEDEVEIVVQINGKVKGKLVHWCRRRQRFCSCES